MPESDQEVQERVKKVFSITPCLWQIHIIHTILIVMGNPGLEGPVLEVAVHNVAEPVTQPKTGLNAGGT